MDALVNKRIPAQLRCFAIPPLMTGESSEEYVLLRDLLIDDIAPQSTMEWLWLFDIAELSWEILRYRRLKLRALDLFRLKAIEALLFRIDSAGIDGDLQPVKRYTRQNAIEWRASRAAAQEIESRLEHLGFDFLAINAEVYLQARDVLAMFEGLTHAAQQRRNVTMKEISAMRSGKTGRTASPALNRLSTL